MSCEFCGIGGGGCVVCDHWCGPDADDPRAWEGEGQADPKLPARMDLFSRDVWDGTFAMLDGEPDWDGESAGRVAAAVERAFRAAVAAELD
jgi:hypothetical protein